MTPTPFHDVAFAQLNAAPNSERPFSDNLSQAVARRLGDVAQRGSRLVHAGAFDLLDLDPILALHAAADDASWSLFADDALAIAVQRHRRIAAGRSPDDRRRGAER